MKVTRESGPGVHALRRPWSSALDIDRWLVIGPIALALLIAAGMVFFG